MAFIQELLARNPWLALSATISFFILLLYLLGFVYFKLPVKVADIQSAQLRSLGSVLLGCVHVVLACLLLKSAIEEHSLLMVLFVVLFFLAPGVCLIFFGPIWFLKFWKTEISIILHRTIGNVKWTFSSNFNWSFKGGRRFSAVLTGFKIIDSSSRVVIPVDIDGQFAVEGLAEQLFMGHDEISEIELLNADNLKTIGRRAFYGCSGIRKIYIKNNASIGDGAFEHCSRLEEVVFDAECNNPDFSIGRVAFGGCVRLKSIIIPDKPEVAFSKDLGDWVRDLGDWIGKDAFERCINLKSISIPASLEGKTDDWGLPEDCVITVRAKKDLSAT